MATNAPYGDGHRSGMVRHRSQVLNPQNGHFVKRDSDTGQFMDVKYNTKPFKGIRKEHN